MRIAIAVFLSIFMSVQIYAASGRGFDGTNDYISASHNTQISQLASYSLMAWYYPLGNPGNNWGRIAHKGRSTTADEYALIDRASLRTLNCRTATDGSSPNSIYTTSSFTNNSRWYFVAVTWDGTDMRCYFDGIEENNSNGSGSTDSDGSDFAIGGHIASSARRVDGNIAHVRLFNRALSGSEILDAMYCVDSSMDGLIGYWPLMESGTDPTFVDVSGNGNDGSGTSFPAETESGPPTAYCAGGQ